MTNNAEHLFVGSVAYYSAQVVITKPWIGWLKQQVLYFSLFWRLKVWDRGASLVGLWWGLFSWLANSQLLMVFLQQRDHEWEREGDRMFSNMSSDKGTDLFRPESYPHGLTDHITSQIFHFQQPSHWALGLQSTKFGATTNIQSITLPFLTSTVLNCLFKSCLFLCWFVCLLLI